MTQTIAPAASTSTLLDAFGEYLTSKKFFSAHTVGAYNVDLIQFLTFLRGEIGPGTGLPHLENDDARLLATANEHIQQFMDYLKAQNYKESSIARKIAATRSFYKWALLSGRTTSNPTVGIKSPPQQKAKPKIVTHDDAVRLLNSISGSDFLSVRDRAMLAIIYATGLRVSEVCDLTLEALKYDEDGIKVEVGGSRKRTLALDETATSSVKRYLAMKANVQHAEQNVIFVNKHGSKLSQRSVRRKLSGYLGAVGLDPSINPSTLRHSFAKHAIQSGQSVEVVSKMLGHRSLTTAKIAYATPQEPRKPDTGSFGGILRTQPLRVA